MKPRQQLKTKLEEKKEDDVKKAAQPPLLIHSLMRIKRSQEMIAYRKSFCTIL